FSFVFFFQAEDGIRDRTVTGVQTCALPISLSRLGLDPRDEPTTAPLHPADRDPIATVPTTRSMGLRSPPRQPGQRETNRIPGAWVQRRGVATFNELPRRSTHNPRQRVRTTRRFPRSNDKCWLNGP